MLGRILIPDIRHIVGDIAEGQVLLIAGAFRSRRRLCRGRSSAVAAGAAELDAAELPHAAKESMSVMAVAIESAFFMCS